MNVAADFNVVLLLLSLVMSLFFLILFLFGATSAIIENFKYAIIVYSRERMCVGSCAYIVGEMFNRQISAFLEIITRI